MIKYTLSQTNHCRLPCRQEHQLINAYSCWVNMWWVRARRIPLHVGSKCVSCGSGTCIVPDSKVHGANMGSTWGRQDPGGPHVWPMNLAIWGITFCLLNHNFDVTIHINYVVLAGLYIFAKKYNILIEISKCITLDIMSARHKLMFICVFLLVKAYFY